MRTCIMLSCIMIFVNRLQEMERLDRLAAREEGGLAVVYGRRRIGKTRLLLHWSSRHHGLYTVADQSSADIQRRYFAEAVAERLPGFADVDYRDWRTLLLRLAREAAAAGWRGPIIFDELPYLVTSSPELPSVLQRWLDHDARQARLVTAVAGSSQRMMQGLVLAARLPCMVAPGRFSSSARSSPCISGRSSGRCRAWVWSRPMRPGEGFRATGSSPKRSTAVFGLKSNDWCWTRWGSLHREPDRLLLEEIPSALEARPILDAIGGGAHRASEIAGRLGRPADLHVETPRTSPWDGIGAKGGAFRRAREGEPAEPL